MFGMFRMYLFVVVVVVCSWYGFLSDWFPDQGQTSPAASAVFNQRNRRVWPGFLESQGREGRAGVSGERGKSWSVRGEGEELKCQGREGKAGSQGRDGRAGVSGERGKS